MVRSAKRKMTKVKCRQYPSYLYFELQFRGKQFGRKLIVIISWLEMAELLNVDYIPDTFTFTFVILQMLQSMIDSLIDLLIDLLID